MDSQAEHESLYTSRDVKIINGFEKNITQTKIKVYKRRWLILAVFCFFSMIAIGQWIQYAIITNIVMKYYNVSATAVNWTSIIYMLVYPPLLLPSAYAINIVGLRTSSIVGAAVTTLGGWLKVIAVSPERFWLVLVGQFLAGLSQLCLLSGAPRLASTWFPSNEVATACSLGAIGTQVGIAVAFILAPIMVRNHEDINDIGNDLLVMSYWVAGLSTLSLISIIFLFQKAPAMPPSPEQALLLETEDLHFFPMLKRLFKNKGFNILVTTYGISIGIYNSVSTHLNAITLVYFENGEEIGGRIGLTFVGSGIVGSLLFGLILDRTQKYRLTVSAMYVLSLFGMLAFTFSFLSRSEVLVNISAGLLGLFVGGFFPIGMSYCTEITYPEPETTSSGILLISSCVYGIIFTIIQGEMLETVGDIWSNIALFVFLSIGTVLTLIDRSPMRRLNARKINVGEIRNGEI